MKGLFLDNYYKTISRMKILLILLTLIGILIFLIAREQFIVQTFIGVTFLSISVLSLIASPGEKKGWDRFEITLPVKRNFILMVKYLSFIIWLVVALIVSSLFTWIVVNLEGYQYFDYGMRDILTIFSVLVSLSLHICSFFYVGLYLFGSDKVDITILISLILSLVLTGAIAISINQSGISIKSGRIIILGVSVVFYFVSYCIANSLYKEKDL